jgi:hypothetical protein
MQKTHHFKVLMGHDHQLAASVVDHSIDSTYDMVLQCYISVRSVAPWLC